MDFINDAVSSMDAFVTAYKLAGVLFSCPVETRYLCLFFKKENVGTTRSHKRLN